MADDHDKDQRTEDATPKKLQEAKKRGQTARSREYASLASMVAGFVAIYMVVKSDAAQIVGFFSEALTFDKKTILTPQASVEHALKYGWGIFWSALPIIGACFLAAITTPAPTNSWLFNFSLIAPNFGRLNPASWPQKVFSVSALVEIIKSIVKAGVMGCAAYIAWSSHQQLLIASATLGLGPAVDELFAALASVVTACLLVMVAISLLDIPYQLHHFAQQLKMTKQEVKEEAKESEGSPEIKRRVRQVQREMARRRMMQELPKADVVVTNPTHYSVALQYNEDGLGVPKVIAKGTEEVAMRIREIAKEHAIPIVEAPPLARALNAHTEIGELIPEKLYVAVAKILVFAFELKRFTHYGGQSPVMPDIEVPQDLQVPADKQMTAGATPAA